MVMKVRNLKNNILPLIYGCAAASYDLEAKKAELEAKKSELLSMNAQLQAKDVIMTALRLEALSGASKNHLRGLYGKNL